MILTLSVALSAISALGVKVTGITQALLPAQVPLADSPKSPALAPVMCAVTVKVKGDRLVNFTMDSVLVADCATLPNAKVVGSTVAGIVGAVLSATVYGPSGSGLSLIVIVAASVPSTPGAKATVIVQVDAAASVVVQVPPVTEKSLALPPLNCSLRVTGRV